MQLLLVLSNICQSYLVLGGASDFNNPVYVVLKVQVMVQVKGVMPIRRM